jgi:DNA repair exonuclease SbcCD ATPase subunit
MSFNWDVSSRAYILVFQQDTNLATFSTIFEELFPNPDDRIAIDKEKLRADFNKVIRLNQHSVSQSIGTSLYVSGRGRPRLHPRKEAMQQIVRLLESKTYTISQLNFPAHRLRKDDLDDLEKLRQESEILRQKLEEIALENNSLRWQSIKHNNDGPDLRAITKSLVLYIPEIQQKLKDNEKAQNLVADLKSKVYTKTLELDELKNTHDETLREVRELKEELEDLKETLWLNTHTRDELVQLAKP